MALSNQVSFAAGFPLEARWFEAMGMGGNEGAWTAGGRGYGMEFWGVQVRARELEIFTKGNGAERWSLRLRNDKRQGGVGFSRHLRMVRADGVQRVGCLGGE